MSPQGNDDSKRAVRRKFFQYVITLLFTGVFGFFVIIVAAFTLSDSGTISAVIGIELVGGLLFALVWQLVAFFKYCRTVPGNMIYFLLLVIFVIAIPFIVYGYLRFTNGLPIF